MESYSTQRLLALRKLTRAAADLLRGRIKEYLATITPLLRPKVVLGNYVEGGAFDLSRPGDKAFKELQEIYNKVAQTKIYRLPQELTTPLEVINPQLEITPVEYEHTATSGNDKKSVVITSPLKWVLTYGGFSPNKFRELLANQGRTGDDLQQFVLHYLMMHVVIGNQRGVKQMLEALHFPVSTIHFPEFGDLPVTIVSSSISTVRPSDDVIVESTEVAGMNVFEEVLNVDDVKQLQDHLREELLELLRSHGEEQ